MSRKLNLIGPLRIEVIGGVTLLLVSLLVRLHQLSFDSLFMDELRQVRYYANDFGDLLADAAGMHQSPLDLWIGKIFFFFSDSDFSARLPAALFGTGSVLVFYALSVRLANVRIAFFFGLVFSLLPYPIYISQDARPYSIAVFFCLLLVSVSVWVLRRARIGVLEFAAIYLSSLFFMMARTLSPLAVCFALGLFVSLGLVRSVVCRYDGWKTHFRFFALFQLALVLSFLTFLPLLLEIMDTGSRYLTVGKSSWLASLQWQDIINPWVAQFEPISAVIAGCSIFTIVTLAVNAGRHITQPSERMLVPFLLIVATATHYLVFSYSTSHPFRPPYSIYVLPLGLLLSVQALPSVAGVLRHLLRRNTSAVVYSISVITLIAVIIAATMNFKSRHIKSDWRGAANYMAENFSENSIFVFETLATTDHWSPEFYGFSRYYPDPYVGFTLSQLAVLLGHASPVTDGEPVLLLFHYRPYLLTEGSKAAIFPSVGADLYPYILDNSNLKIKRFTGLTVVSLIDTTGLFTDELYRLVTLALESMSQNSSVTNFHLVAAHLTPDYQARDYHLNSAASLARRDQLDLVRDVWKRYKSPPRL